MSMHLPNYNISKHRSVYINIHARISEQIAMKEFTDRMYQLVNDLTTVVIDAMDRKLKIAI